MGRKLEDTIAVLNGAIGDYLAKTGNGLATEMSFVAKVKGGEPLPLTRDALTRALTPASPRVAVLVHGLMCTESIWEHADGSDYGALIARDHGFTPLYLRYNTGLAIADNGALLARALGELVAHYPTPIEELLPIGYSMGGLLVRAACHVGRQEAHPWLDLVRRAFYVGTPHRGAPLERVGRVVSKVLRAVPDPYTRLVADLADLRSDGVKDLGHADLRHEDRARPSPILGLRDARHPVPLLPEIRHYLVAGSLSDDPRIATFFGDAMVPVPSATDDQVDPSVSALPPSHVKLARGLSHVAIAHDPSVYAHLTAWLTEDTGVAR